MTEQSRTLLTQEQTAFLAKARRTAYKDELYPNREKFLKEGRKLMVEAHALGIYRIHPLLLGDNYEIARNAARRKLDKDVTMYDSA